MYCQKNFSRIAALTGIAAISATFLVGCGGGSNSGSGNSSQNLVPIATSNAALNSIVRGGASALTTNNLTTLASQYQADIQANPGNLPAQFGYASSESALIALTLEQALGLSTSSGSVRPAVSGSSTLGSLTPYLLFWNLPKAIANGGKLPSVSALVLGSTPLAPHDSSNINPVQLESALSVADVQLTSVEQSLAVLNADPSFSVTIADPGQPTNTSATVIVGHVETEVFAAFIGVVHSVVSTTLIWDINYGSFNFNEPASQFFATWPANGATIPVSEYLPGGTFGHLTQYGKLHAANVKSELTTAANSADAGIAAYTAPGYNSSGHLINAGTAFNSQLMTAQSDISQYLPYLSNPEQISLTNAGVTHTVTIDLSAWFNDPPANLEAFFPPLTVSGSNSSSLTATLSAPASAYPDPTFGGLFPSGGVQPNTSFGIDGNTPIEEIDAQAAP